MSEGTLFVAAPDRTDPDRRAADLECESSREGQTASLGPGLVAPTS
jgi:hypothetical protein